MVDVLRYGYRLHWIHHPPPLSPTPVHYDSYLSNQEKLDILSKEVEDLLAKQAVTLLPYHQAGPGFYSRLFVVQKKGSNKWRPVIDLSTLNHFLVKEKFKMLTPAEVMQALKPGMWATSVDLKDAYLHIPIHPEDRKFLRFVFLGKVYQFRALPFGLTSAPYVFTRVTKAFAKYVQTRGIPLLHYIDDFCHRQWSRSLCAGKTNLLVRLCRQWGWLVNLEKSDLTPSQDLIYIGIRFLLSIGLALIPPARLSKFMDWVVPFLTQESVPFKEWQCLLGLLNSMDRLIPLGRLHVRGIQSNLKNFAHLAISDDQALIPVLESTKVDLNWWLREDVQQQGCPLTPFQPDLFLVTDASTRGWGAHLQGMQASGLWTAQDSAAHINILELKAVLLAAQQLLPKVDPSLTNLLVVSDNTTVVAYINHQGGTLSHSLTILVRQFLLETYDLGITVRARHIPSAMNVWADSLSRGGQILQSEWSILPSLLLKVWRAWFRPMVDLFATRFNARLPLFVSPVPDPLALEVDAFSISWANLDSYAFPPLGSPKLLARLLAKLSQSQNSTMILIAPCWPGQPWFPDLIDLLVDIPLALPPHPRLLKQPRQAVFHQCPLLYNLHAWRLSTRPFEIKAFRRKLLASSGSLSDLPRRRSTRSSGKSSVVGVKHGILIHSKPLFL